MTQNGEGTDRASSIRRLLKRAHTMVCLVLILFALVSFANAQASRNKKPSSKPASSTNGSPTTFTLDVDQMYCDESLPYSYQSTRTGVTLKVGVAQNTALDHDVDAWSKLVGNLWSASASPLPAIIVTFAPQATFSSDGKGKDAGTNDAPTTDGLIDDGLTILGNPTHELSDDTFDAQRLLVRTLFGPNPFQVACAPAYLRYPTGDVPLNALLPLNKGAGYPLSLNDKDAPQYYLINIVRWKDATAPKDASSITASNSPSNPSLAGNPPVPFFQAASDDWYLLNYSDAKDRKQDISQWFHKITPSLMSQTLRLIGSDKVMFLGIHLAPLPALGTKPYNGIANPNPKSAPATEQAWFDAVTLKYTFQASAATPTNMADLNTLLSILTKGLGGTGQAPTNPPAPKVLTKPTVADALKQLNLVVVALNDALDQEVRDEALDLFFRQLTTATLPAISPLNLESHVNAQDYGVAKVGSTTNELLKIMQPNKGPKGASVSLNSDVEQELTALSTSDSSRDEAKSTAVAAIQQDIDSVSQMQAQINARKTALESALKPHGIVLSTYQGRYAAGLLTNLQNLPVTLASNWNATFVALPNLEEWASNAGVYDLTKPATTDADKSNRAGVPPAAPDATNDKKSLMAPATGAAPIGSVTGLTDAPSSPVIALSSHPGFGPSLPLDDPSGQTDFVKESRPVFVADSKGSSTSQPATTPDSPAKPPKSKDAKNSSKNTTAATSTICTVSLTKGKTTDNPPTLQHQSDCSDQQTKILNEGPARWDFSFIVPINGYKDVTFQSGSSSTSSSSSTPGDITAKTITRENAYGVADLFFVPEDLINRPYIGIPHVVLGLPFSGKVFNKPYFAVGETINVPKLLGKWKFIQNVPILNSLTQKDLPVSVRPVFGWVYNKVYPAGGAPTYRSWKPQWAVEMSFSSIKDAVSTFGKKSSKGSGNTTKQTTPSSVPDSN